MGARGFGSVFNFGGEETFSFLIFRTTSTGGRGEYRGYRGLGPGGLTPLIQSCP